MPEAIEPREIEMNIRDYLLIIHKRRWVILVVFLLVVIINIVHVNSQIPIYRATSSVRILQRKTVATLLTDWLAGDLGDPVTSQARVIESYSVIERVVKELGLVSKDTTSEELLKAVDSLRGMIKATPVKETNVINISVEDTKAKRSALIANKIAASYIEENLREKTKEAHAVKEFIQEQLNEVSKKLKTSEESLKEFRQSGKATGIAISFQNRLAELETEKARFLRTYTELHPNVVKINEEIQAIKEQIKLMPDLELQFARLTREMEINENSYKGLQEKFEDARIAEAENVPDVTLISPALVPSAPIRPNKAAAMMLGILAALSLSAIAAFTVEQLDTSIGTIDDIERYLALPVLGVVPYLKVEVEESKEKNLLKKLFLSRKEKQDLIAETLKKQLLIYYSNQSPIFEAYRILRTNIIIEVLKNQTKGKTILISSAGPQEGKSINVANLGVCLAQAGHKVLIVDADLRRSSINKIFGFLAHQQRGLTDVLRQTTKLEDTLCSLTDLLIGSIGFEKIVTTPGMDNLNFLLCGSFVANPTELLGSQDMSSILEKIKEKFDIILVDSPPILAVADASLLAPKMDAVLLIYKVGKTAGAAIMRAKKQLETAGASPKGIILNNISSEVEMRSQYYYYRYRYYPPQEEQK